MLKISQIFSPNDIIKLMLRLTLIWLLLWMTQSQPEPVWTDNCINVTSAGTCAQCVQGFYLQYFLCLPCAPLCQCSSQYNYCQSCMSLNYKDTNYSRLAIYQPSTLRCILCDTFISSCLQCSDFQTCTKCYGGLYPLTSANITICSQQPCLPNCEICANQLTCQLCKNGSYLDPIAKTCSQPPCMQYCLFCNGTNSCAICQSGFRLDPKRGCVACTPNCLQCTQDELQCDLCAPGYYYGNFSCISSSSSNCVLYYPNAATVTDCQVCEPGYFVLYGSCSPCVGCQLCSLQFLCQTPCQPGSTSFNYACLVPFVIYEAWVKLGLLVSLLMMLL